MNEPLDNKKELLHIDDCSILYRIEYRFTGLLNHRFLKIDHKIDAVGTCQKALWILADKCIVEIIK